jgi:hypothetical protein
MNLYKVTGYKSGFETITDCYYVAESYKSCAEMCEGEQVEYLFIQKIELVQQNIKVEGMEDLEEINDRIKGLETKFKTKLRVSDE